MDRPAALPLGLSCSSRQKPLAVVLHGHADLPCHARCKCKAAISGLLMCEKLNPCQEARAAFMDSSAASLELPGKRCRHGPLVLQLRITNSKPIPNNRIDTAQRLTAEGHNQAIRQCSSVFCEVCRLGGLAMQDGLECGADEQGQDVAGGVHTGGVPVAH